MEFANLLLKGCNFNEAAKSSRGRMAFLGDGEEWQRCHFLIRLVVWDPRAMAESIEQIARLPIALTTRTVS
jgi:hypothetical protein